MDQGAQPSAQTINARRVAFFGGSFDPPHLGHLGVARAARATLGLDTVLFAPVGAQPLKPQGSTASFEDRLAMTRLAIAGEPGFAVSLADAPKASGAPNYTLETLLTLCEELPPESALFCLMGADAFAAFSHWHRAAEIPFVAPLIVASRPGQRLSDLMAALPVGLMVEDNDDLPQIAGDLKGHGFSRAKEESPEDAALATEGSSSADKVVPQGLKPCISMDGISARLKSCPFKDQIELRRCILRNPAGAQTPLYLLPGLEIEISASAIREQMQIREQARSSAGAAPPEHALLPVPVSEYIRAHGLYR
jgi:nicotinate-nucleotide adenylyltransferase